MRKHTQLHTQVSVSSAWIPTDYLPSSIKVQTFGDQHPMKSHSPGPTVKQTNNSSPGSCPSLVPCLGQACKFPPSLLRENCATLVGCNFVHCFLFCFVVAAAASATASVATYSSYCLMVCFSITIRKVLESPSPTTFLLYFPLSLCPPPPPGNSLTFINYFSITIYVQYEYQQLYVPKDGLSTN